jgi:uncharacterized membrane protein YeaQ/YmgE (transglycosylase-associated protein family)
MGETIVSFGAEWLFGKRWENVVVDAIGAVCFGLVIGWVTYRTLRRTGETVAVSNIASVIGAVGGAAVTGMFRGHLFGWYCMGLAAGFFGYLILAVTKLKDVPWLGDGN